MSAPRDKILLVDDEEANLALIEALLEHENYTIIKARDGVEALDLFEKIQPNLVLLDLMMPRLNGFEVCKRLRHLNSSRYVPIIMLSGYDDTDAKRQALEVGANDFLRKPVEGIELLARIRSHLHPLRCKSCTTKIASLAEKALSLPAAQADSTLSGLLNEIADICKH